MTETPLPSTRPTGVRRLALRAGLGLLHATLWVSPRPMAIAVRRQFATSVRERTARLDARAPADVVAVLDEPYGSSPDELIDVFAPASAKPGDRLPTVLWTHGGAFVGGTKEELAGYFRTIAAAGFTVVAPRYARAPEARYPTPVRQVMAALAHVQADAERLHVDPDRLVLAGDSAGAQISAQVAAVVTDPGYATVVGVAPAVTPARLRGVALCCGVFDLGQISDSSPLKDVLVACGWAYSGTRRFRTDERFMGSMSVARHVTAAFPPTFVTVGNADPLRSQSLALAATLEAAGVDVETLFYPADHEPPLPHEYQFDLDLTDGRVALERLLAFFARCTAGD